MGEIRIEGVTAEEWAKRYNIPMDSHPCPKCGVARIANIPFALKDVRGLKSKDHGCGPGYIYAVMTPIGDMRDEWLEIFRGIPRPAKKRKKSSRKGGGG